MAMEINGNLPDYAVKKQNYSSYAAQNVAGSAKKKEAPSVFKVGNGCSLAKRGTTLTINPKLLKKMQNDPKQEKETKELLRGVESAMNLIDSINKASGWTTVYRHSYIDENGKYHCISQTRNDFMLNMSDKLREERKKNSEKLLEKMKEKASSKDGTIYLYDTDMKILIEAIKEDNAGKANTKQQAQVGANIDLKA